MRYLERIAVCSVLAFLIAMLTLAACGFIR